MLGFFPFKSPRPLVLTIHTVLRIKTFFTIHRHATNTHKQNKKISNIPRMSQEHQRPRLLLTRKYSSVCYPRRGESEDFSWPHKERLIHLTHGILEPAWDILMSPGALFTCEWQGGIASYFFHGPSALNTEGDVVFLFFVFLFQCLPEVVVPTQMYTAAWIRWIPIGRCWDTIPRSPRQCV